MNQTIKADLTEMIFAQRERNYGAYVLRKRYPKVLFLATLITIVLALSLPLSSLIAHELGLVEKVEGSSTNYYPVIVTPPVIPPLEKKATPPLPPPPKLPKPKVKTLAFNPPTPAPEEELQENTTLTDQETLKAAPSISFTSQEGIVDPYSIPIEEEEGFGIPTVLQETGVPDPNMLVIPDEYPHVLNMKEVAQAIGFPSTVKNIGLEGQVVVRVLIDERGVYQKHLVLNGIHPILEKAVEEQLPNLRFTPAIQGKKPIPFWVNIPFSFKLLK